MKWPGPRYRLRFPNEPCGNLRGRAAAGPWQSIAAGIAVVLVSLVHVSSAGSALNYFDPPKRLLAAIMGLAMAVIWSARRSRLGRTPLLLSLALLMWIVARTLCKPHPDVELEVLFTWMLPVLLFILAGSMDQARGARIFGVSIVLAGLLQAGVMVLQRFGFDPFFFDTTSGLDYKPGRMVGTIGYQNQAVDFLAVSAAGIFLATRSACLRLVFMALMLFVAGLTGNRGGILAFSAALLMCQLLPVWFHDSLSTRRRWMAAVGVAAGVCGLFAMMTLIPETGGRFREVLTSARHSPAVASRVLMARVGCVLFRERPWTGWGAGEYAFQYLDRLGAVLPAEKTHEVLRSVVFAREAHNDYLQFAVEFGIVGVLLASALLAVAVLRVARARSRDADAVAAIAFAAAYMAVSSLFSFPWQTSTSGPVAAFLLGWLWPGQVPPEREGDQNFGNVLPAVWARAVKALLVGLSLVTAGWFALDSCLNRAVPHALANRPALAVRFLPQWAYRYRALVGGACASQGMHREAEKELIRAECGYRDIPLWNNLGHTRAKLRKWREAREVYERWVKCGLDHSTALLNLSIAQEQTGQFRDAAETLARRQELWPGSSPDGIRRLAVLQLQSGSPRKAQETLQTYKHTWTTADSKTVAEIENLAGGICLVLGEKQDAETWFRSALDKNPDLKSARRNLDGLSILETGNTNSAGRAE